MRCYDIAKEYEGLEIMAKMIADNKDGDNLDMKEALARQLEELGHTTESKLENMSKMIRNMELESANYKAEEERMAKKRKSLDNQVAYIKESLIKPILEQSGKITAGVFTVSLRKSQAVKVDDKIIEDKYKTSNTVITIDKASIKKDIKAGSVLGAELITNQSVQIK